MKEQYEKEAMAYDHMEKLYKEEAAKYEDPDDNNSALTQYHYGMKKAWNTLTVMLQDEWHKIPTKKHISEYSSVPLREQL